MTVFECMMAGRTRHLASRLKTVLRVAYLDQNQKDLFNKDLNTLTRGDMVLITRALREQDQLGDATISYAMSLLRGYMDRAGIEIKDSVSPQKAGACACAGSKKTNTLPTSGVEEVDKRIDEILSVNDLIRKTLPKEEAAQARMCLAKVLGKVILDFAG